MNDFGRYIYRGFRQLFEYFKNAQHRSPLKTYAVYFQKVFFLKQKLTLYVRTATSLWAKVKFGIPQSENCIPLTDSSPLMGEKIT